MAARLRHREFHFPVQSAGKAAGARPRASTANRRLRSPRRLSFMAADPGLWSPEDALVAATASCLAVTIAALAERDQLPLRHLSVTADGTVGRRPDGRFGFVRIEQTVVLETDAEHEHAARALVTMADDGCLVSVSLDVPVQTTVELQAPVPVD